VGQRDSVISNQLDGFMKSLDIRFGLEAAGEKLSLSANW
jgi:hypothetical protein